jgi:hypothetical protein
MVSIEGAAQNPTFLPSQSLCSAGVVDKGGRRQDLHCVFPAAGSVRHTVDSVPASCMEDRVREEMGACLKEAGSSRPCLHTDLLLLL